MSTSATPDPVIRQIVDTMRALAGPHPGFRPVHAKGLVCSGMFRASAEARGVTRAPHLAGPAVPITVRFANSNGNPDVHDGIPNGRSMAVKFQLGGGRSADILANSVEGFIARTHSRQPAGLVLASIATIRSDATGADRVHLRRVFEREVTRSRGSQLAAGDHNLVAAFDGP